MLKFKLWVGNITTQADNNCIFKSQDWMMD